MDRRYLAFCAHDPLFYDRPELDGTDPGTTDLVTRGAFSAVAPTPAGWRATVDRVWRSLAPPDLDLPEQGWKVHVTATSQHAERTLALVADHCRRHGVAFKHLVSPRVLLARNSKQADRAASGKFVTVYPDPARFEETVAALSHALEGTSGPTILSDLRIGDGPVHVRYGGFLPMWTVRDSEYVNAIRRPDGELVPDVREPRFVVPDFVTLPPFLAEHAARRRLATAFPFRVRAALQFSNGGGVYRAEPVDGGPEMILKEARPHAGLDDRGRDAVTRLHHEHAVLARLADVDAVPTCGTPFTAGDHLFLPLERRPGHDLHRWVADHFPLLDPDPDPAAVADYTRRALAVGDRVAEVLDALHTRGVAFGDLHPGNVLVHDAAGGPHVSLVDFELAENADAPHHGSGAPGFTVGPGVTGREADAAALTLLRLWLFHPTAAVLALSRAPLPLWIDHVAERFPVPADRITRWRAALLPTVPAPRSPDEPLVDEPLVDALLAGIDGAATVQRRDRLFPGDVRQFDVGGLGFGHGAAGVLHARRCAGAPSNPGYERWLLDAVAAEPPRAPGFWEGAHGVAWVLDGLGHPDAADQVLAGVREAFPDGADGLGVRRGRAGAGLALLDLADRRDDAAVPHAAGSLREHGLALAEELRSRPQGGPCPDNGAGRRVGGRGPTGSGLLDGATGAALLFLRAHDLTGDPTWLDAAERAVEADLADAVPGPSATLHVRDRSGVQRTLPYLGAGSAGVALGVHALGLRAPDRPVVAALPALLAACRTQFVAHPGLSWGAAGLAWTLRTIGATEHATEHASEHSTQQAITRHIAAIRRALVPHAGGLVPVGHQLLRCSTDVDTGSAGVLLALTEPNGHDRHVHDSRDHPASTPWAAVLRPAPVLTP